MAAASGGNAATCSPAPGAAGNCDVAVPGVAGGGSAPEVTPPTEVEAAGIKQTLESEMSDYKSVDGIMIPHTLKQSVNGSPRMEMTIEKIELNAPIDDALFKMPKK